MSKDFSGRRRTAWQILLGGLMALFLVTPAWAAGEFNVGPDKVAIKGYDPVAYFVMNKPVMGDSAYRASHEGATYQFATAGNKALFESDPDRYVPEYGGYCSYGVRLGRKFDVDPHAWRIVDDRLFLQLDQGTQVVWLKDLDRNISIADSVWPKIREKLDKDLAQ